MTETINEQKKLAVYFGYPSSVNATFTVNGASAVFKDYDVVVFGTGLENSTHPDHQNTINIINHVDMVNTEIFGYVDATLNLNTIQNSIDNWHAMGVKGIFLDQFGYDFGVSRIHQREMIWCIREKGNGLKAFVNAWNPDDVFGSNIDPTYNPDGLETRIGNNDYYLAESFAVKNGLYDDDDYDLNNIKDWQDKATQLVTYRNTFGTEIYAIATLGSVPFDQNLVDYSYYTSLINNFNGYGFGEENYSASSAQLPFRTRPAYYGNVFNTPLTINNDVYSRSTNAGLNIDTSTHTIDIVI